MLFLALSFGLPSNGALAQQVPKRSPEGVGYLEYLPAGYRTSALKYPLMIFLHGMGEKGNGSDAEIWRVARNGPPKLIQDGHKMNFVVNGVEETFIVISPQLSNNYGGFVEILPAFIPYIFEHYKSSIDRTRVYLTGLSMGGGAVWQMPTRYPQWFTAIVPVCAAAWPDPSTPPCAIANNNIPVWAHHGDADNTIQLVHSQEWVRQINACTPTPNPKAELRIYPGVGHDAWTPAYRTDNQSNTPNVYQWMLRHKKVSNAAQVEVVVWNGANWLPRAPIEADDVIISGTYPHSSLATALQRTFVCRNLSILGGVTMAITDGSTVTVNGRFDNAGKVQVENGGSFLQGSASVAGSAGQFLVQRRRYLSQVGNSGAVSYNYWSMPVAGVNVSGLPGPAEMRFSYNEPTQAWQLASGTMAAGRGYTAGMWGINSTAEFWGQPNNGNTTVPVTRNGIGYNLVGNPYPSAIDLRLFFNDPDNSSRLNGTAWFWDDNDLGTGTGSYLVANQLSGIRYVPVCQGFFVLANSAGNIVFKNQHRVAGNNQIFYRTEGDEFERTELIIKKEDGLKDRFFLGFGKNFTEQFDPAFDAGKMDNSSGLNLSMLWEGNRWTTLALPEERKQRQTAFPISLQVKEAGKYTFSVGEVENPIQRPMFLEDRSTGEYHLLHSSREYNFQLAAGTYNNRFFMRFGNEAVGAENEQAANSPVRIFSYANQLYLFTRGGLEAPGDVAIYNSLGVVVETFPQVKLSGVIQKLRAQVGTPSVYIVKVSIAGQTYEQRVWIEK